MSYGGNRVLDAVDLTVSPAEVHALIGPNGAGKSTLVDAVTGFAPAYEGRVLFEGRPIDQLGARARAGLGVRRTFQHQRAIEAITVGDYLRLAAGSGKRTADSGRTAGSDRTDAARSERIAAVGVFLGLPEPRVPIRLMDAGSRRVLEIAGALASEPRLLLLDEPAAGLGDAESLALAERVRRIPAEFGCAVLLIEHDMRFVRAASTRTAVLDDGRLIAAGQTSEVLGDPRVIDAYLGRETAS